MIGNEYGGDDSICEHVDLPVAIDPVKPMSLMMALSVDASETRHEVYN